MQVTIWEVRKKNKVPMKHKREEDIERVTDEIASKTYDWRKQTKFYWDVAEQEVI